MCLVKSYLKLKKKHERNKKRKNKNYKKLICGIDEAGREALAGPIVIAGIVLPSRFRFQRVFPNGTIKDSKELSKKQREALFGIIKKYAFQIIVEVIHSEEINKRGINWANIEGFKRIINKVRLTNTL